jgi:hypothetical protein
MRVSKISMVKKALEPDVVVHICNPSYSEGGDLEHLGLRPVWAKSY